MTSDIITITAIYQFIGPSQEGLEHNIRYLINAHFVDAQRVNVEICKAPFTTYSYPNSSEFVCHWKYETDKTYQEASCDSLSDSASNEEMLQLIQQIE